MGFSHYWYRPQILDGDKFKAATEDFRKMLPVFKKMGIILIDTYERRSKPALTAHLIHFNGKPGVEDFFIEAMFTDRRSSSGKYFAFCKTGHQPYDFAVMCALLIFKHHFGEPFKVSSDGRLPLWTPAINAVREHLGYTEWWDWKEEEEESEGFVDRFLITVKEQPCLKSESPIETDGEPSSPSQA